MVCEHLLHPGLGVFPPLVDPKLHVQNVRHAQGHRKVRPDLLQIIVLFLPGLHIGGLDRVQADVPDQRQSVLSPLGLSMQPADPDPVRPLSLQNHSLHIRLGHEENGSRPGEISRVVQHLHLAEALLRAVLELALHSLEPDSLFDPKQEAYGA